MPDPNDLRVSDEERDRAAREIREHFAAGRLSQEELDERLQGAYAARTQSELTAVTHDLPRLPATHAEERAALVARRAHLRRRLLQETGGSVGVFLLCTFIWVATGASGMFWPIWVALVALIPLVRNSWRLYGPAPQLDAVERELARRSHRSHRSRRRSRRHRHRHRH